MKRIPIQVEEDHLQRLSRPTRPLQAVEEMIWNALDADAHTVRVRMSENALGGIERIEIADSGHGMTPEAAETAFEHLGGSWKRARRRTPGGRELHGKSGEGRFRAFALGDEVSWETVADTSDGRRLTTITGRIAAIKEFELSDPEPTERPVGTTVIVPDARPTLGSLVGEKPRLALTASLALYLTKYPDVHVWYLAYEIRPDELLINRSDYDVEWEGGRGQLTVLEWSQDVKRTLLLCDEDGMALHELSPGIHAPGFEFTAYLRWAGFAEIGVDTLQLEELHPAIRQAVQACQRELRSHFRRRAAEQAGNTVERWKAERIYPYEEPPRTAVERVEREVFDVVAFNVANYSPGFEASDAVTKRLSFRLLAEAVTQSPEAVQRILQEVIDLPKERQEDLSRLLDRTSLAAVVGAAKRIADRLDFLTGLEHLLFDEDNREVLLERTQLHRIVAEETWVFGEAYALTVDDRSLTEVLQRHLELLGRPPDDGAEVLREDGRRGIVDLMLSRRVPQPRGREHLVVELKRPNVELASKELQQIRDYAFAVAEDERFKDTGTIWRFWLVGNSISTQAQKQATQAGKPVGVLYDGDDGAVEILVRTWGQIIEDCRARLKFVQDGLEYASSSEHALEYLRRTHEKYLPQTVRGQLASVLRALEADVASPPEKGG